MTDRIALQNAEFDALTKLAERWASLRQVAVVDDDYPEYRHYYESAMQTFLEAVSANRPDRVRAAAAPEHTELVSREAYDRAVAALDAVRAENLQLREHIAGIHNRVRHELSAEIEGATDRAFKSMSAIPILRAARSAK